MYLIGADIEEEQKQSKSRAPYTQMLLLLTVSPVSSLGLTMMGEQDLALCCLSLTPCCPETDGPQSLPHHRAPAARVSGGTAWVESWRLILDLETPCQQLWLGSSWTGLPVGRSESPCREPRTRPSRSALGHTSASALGKACGKVPLHRG